MQKLPEIPLTVNFLYSLVVLTLFIRVLPEEAVVGLHIHCTMTDEVLPISDEGV